MGVGLASEVTEALRRNRFNQQVSPEEVRAALAEQVIRLVEPVTRPLRIDRTHRPFVILVIGVNGSGKTTTIAKLAKQYRDQGLSVVMAAGDTFRAAAVEQLQIWGKRIGAPVVTRPADPRSSGTAAAEPSSHRRATQETPNEQASRRPAAISRITSPG